MPTPLCQRPDARSPAGAAVESVVGPRVASASRPGRRRRPSNRCRRVFAEGSPPTTVPGAHSGRAGLGETTWDRCGGTTTGKVGLQRHSTGPTWCPARPAFRVIRQIRANTPRFPVVAGTEAPDRETGKAIPYRIYDLTTDTGWVNVGTDHDTAAFAVASVRLAKLTEKGILRPSFVPPAPIRVPAITRARGWT